MPARTKEELVDNIVDQMTDEDIRYGGRGYQAHDTARELMLKALDDKELLESTWKKFF